ncbi:TPA: hypothetical protein N0F65_006183 [Lagenidium giganteum]|uniref:Uncharacterized protein n=1 Tax=Lagenidium giganteum TaxID=4803 RepID=A0AAV2Z4L8_9STRA|nr:TPA: hypothetical protein N0F65_006183 [Lagenidium giganteum]
MVIILVTDPSGSTVKVANFGLQHFPAEHHSNPRYPIPPAHDAVNYHSSSSISSVCDENDDVSDFVALMGMAIPPMSPSLPIIDDLMDLIESLSTNTSLQIVDAVKGLERLRAKYVSRDHQVPRQRAPRALPAPRASSGAQHRESPARRIHWTRPQAPTDRDKTTIAKRCNPVLAGSDDAEDIDAAFPSPTERVDSGDGASNGGGIMEDAVVMSPEDVVSSLMWGTIEDQKTALSFVQKPERVPDMSFLLEAPVFDFLFGCAAYGGSDEVRLLALGTLVTLICEHKHAAKIMHEKLCAAPVLLQLMKGRRNKVERQRCAQLLLSLVALDGACHDHVASVGGFETLIKTAQQDNAFARWDQCAIADEIGDFMRDRAQVCEREAKVAKEQGDTAQARDKYSEAIAWNNRDDNLFLSRCNLCLAIGEHKMAEADAREYIRRRPYLKCGMALAHQGKRAEAVKVYRQGVSQIGYPYPTALKHEFDRCVNNLAQ